MLRAFTQGRSACRLYRHNSLSARLNTTRLASSQPSLPKPRTRNWTLPIAGGLFVGVASLYLFLPDTSRSAPTFYKEPISARHFTPVTVISNEDSGPNTKILKLKVLPHQIPKDGEDPIGFEPIWSVCIKDDDIQVERPYTPLESVDEEGNMVFWVKRYPKGEVGRWLHSKRPGDVIELRGPLRTLNWKDGEWDEVILISGGTGITPFYQFIRKVFEHPTAYSQNTRFSLIHGSRTPEELPPEQILGPLVIYAQKHPDRFRLKLLVDADDGSKPPTDVPALERGRISDDQLTRIIGVPEPGPRQSWFGYKEKRSAISPRTLFLVCGPEPMIAAIAGPYGRNYSQGPTLGILGRLGATPNQVRKL